MKILTKPIGLFGIFYFFTGVLLNINMYVQEAWPTIMFFVLMLIGFGYLLVAWKVKLNIMAQMILGLLPAAGYLLLNEIYPAM